MSTFIIWEICYGLGTLIYILTFFVAIEASNIIQIFANFTDIGSENISS